MQPIERKFVELANKLILENTTFNETEEENLLLALKIAREAVFCVIYLNDSPKSFLERINNIVPSDVVRLFPIFEGNTVDKTLYIIVIAAIIQLTKDGFPFSPEMLEMDKKLQDKHDEVFNEEMMSDTSGVVEDAVNKKLIELSRLALGENNG